MKGLLIGDQANDLKEVGVSWCSKHKVASCICRSLNTSCHAAWLQGRSDALLFLVIIYIMGTFCHVQLLEHCQGTKAICQWMFIWVQSGRLKQKSMVSATMCHSKWCVACEYQLNFLVRYLKYGRVQSAALRLLAYGQPHESATSIGHWKNEFVPKTSCPILFDCMGRLLVVSDLTFLIFVQTTRNGEADISTYIYKI